MKVNSVHWKVFRCIGFLICSVFMCTFFCILSKYTEFKNEYFVHMCCETVANVLASNFLTSNFAPTLHIIGSFVGLIMQPKCSHSNCHHGCQLEVIIKIKKECL